MAAVGRKEPNKLLEVLYPIGGRAGIEGDKDPAHRTKYFYAY